MTPVAPVDTSRYVHCRTRCPASCSSFIRSASTCICIAFAMPAVAERLQHDACAGPVEVDTHVAPSALGQHHLGRRRRQPGLRQEAQHLAFQPRPAAAVELVADEHLDQRRDAVAPRARRSAMRRNRNSTDVSPCSMAASMTLRSRSSGCVDARSMIVRVPLSTGMPQISPASMLGIADVVWIRWPARLHPSAALDHRVERRPQLEARVAAQCPGRRSAGEAHPADPGDERVERRHVCRRRTPWSRV